jgi:hypothetical protein
MLYPKGKYPDGHADLATSLNNLGLIGPTGDVTVLIPNMYHPDTAVQAGEVVTFPGTDDRFHFQFLEPPGPERLIALAAARPLHLRPEDFDQSGQLVCARPTTRSIGIVVDDIGDGLLGRCEIDFYVSALTEACRHPGPTEGAAEFKALELG